MDKPGPQPEVLLHRSCARRVATLARRPIVVSDWLAHEVVAVDLDGHREVILEVPSMPFSFDWLPDGRLLVLSNGDGRRLQRREPDGSLVTQAELTSLVADGDLSNRRVWARETAAIELDRLQLPTT